MIALVSNDDGYYSGGIQLLYDICSSMFKEVHVVAPDRDCSGRSSSLTLRTPIFANTRRNGFIAVEANPADCIQIALSGHLIPHPNIVVAGINHGANLADDVVYSGTVAAAFEGRFLDYPSIAFSVTASEPKHWDSIKQEIINVLELVLKSDFPKGTLFNVNIPDIKNIKGIRITKLGQRTPPGKVQIKTDDRGRRQFWMGTQGEPVNVDQESDFHAINEGYVSVTPLSFDLTDYNVFDQLKNNV